MAGAHPPGLDLGNRNCSRQAAEPLAGLLW